MPFLANGKEKVKKFFKITSKSKKELKAEAENHCTDDTSDRTPLIGNGDLQMTDVEDHSNIFDRVDADKNSSTIGVIEFAYDEGKQERKKSISFGEARLHNTEEEMCDSLKQFSSGLHLKGPKPAEIENLLRKKQKPFCAAMHPMFLWEGRQVYFCLGRSTSQGRS
jgi:hypothetical protein